MVLSYKNWIYKVRCVVRFYWTRIYFGRRFTCPATSMIGRRCSINILGSGFIRCKERIIIDDDAMLFSKAKLSIGSRFSMNKFSRIVAHENIEIGDHVTIGQMVSILDHDHDYKFEDENLKLDGYCSAPIRIGDNIWIGDKCTILKGVEIGSNAIIGANSLINKDVPSNVVVGGNPFRILKRL